MQLQFFHCRNFRNLVEQEVRLPPGVTLVVGENGHGKTNLLEVLSFLSSTRSFRTSRTEELIHWGESELSVHAHFSDSVGSRTLEVRFSKGDGKEVMLDGKKVSSAKDFLGTLPSVLFSPNDLDLVKGGPQTRRQFLDKHLIDVNPQLLPHVVRYQRALRQKAQLLRQPLVTPAHLSPWNEILALEGEQLWRARAVFIEGLLKRALPIHLSFTKNTETLDLKLCYSGKRIEMRDSFFSDLERAREQEVRVRRPLLGPHKDELLILINNKEARAFASQGQTRTLVLALKLAVVQFIEDTRGESPLVLLDDVDSELDAARRKELLAHLCQSTRQVLVTTTETTPYAGQFLAQVTRFRMREGKIDYEAHTQ